MEMCPDPVSIPLGHLFENGNQSGAREALDSCVEVEHDLSTNIRTSPVPRKEGPVLDNIRTKDVCESTRLKDQELSIKDQISQIPPEIARKLLSIYQEHTQEKLSDVTRENDSQWMTSQGTRSRSPPLTPKHALDQHPQRQHRGDVFRFDHDLQGQYPHVTESVRRQLFRSSQIPASEPLSTSMDVYPQMSPSIQSPFRVPMTYSISRDSRMEPRSPYYEHAQYSGRSPSRALCREIDYYNEPHESGIFRTPKRRRSDDLDDYLPPVKRNRVDLEREKSLQYLQELRTDVSTLREKLRKPDAEVPRPSDCTCAVMEKQFLELAESAYRSIRRFDCTPKGFEQFRRELIQTNDVIKDSLDVLKHIKQFCEHNNSSSN